MSVIDYINRPFEDGEQKQEVGIGGFRAYARVSESSTLSSSAPTTYLEDGSPVNDHVVQDPLVINIEGEVSDVYIEREPALDLLTRTQAEIGNIASKYAGDKTIATIQRGNAAINDVLNIARGIDEVIADGKQALSFLGNQDEESKSNQEFFLDEMEAIHAAKKPIAIQLKYRTHETMVITSFVYSINNSENKISFKITAQKIRFAETTFTDINRFFKKPSQALAGQASGESDKGVQEPKKDQSLLGKVSEALGF